MISVDLLLDFDNLILFHLGWTLHRQWGSWTQRPWMRGGWRNHRDRPDGFSCLRGAALSCNPRSCREWRVGVHWTHGNAVVNHTLCMFRWLIFQLPRSLISCPYFWSSLMSGAWHQSRPECVVYEDWLSVQEKLSFDCWCKGTTIWSWNQIFPLQIFRGCS